MNIVNDNSTAEEKEWWKNRKDDAKKKFGSDGNWIWNNEDEIGRIDINIGIGASWKKIVTNAKEVWKKLTKDQQTEFKLLNQLLAFRFF